MIPGAQKQKNVHAKRTQICRRNAASKASPAFGDTFQTTDFWALHSFDGQSNAPKRRGRLCTGVGLRRRTPRTRLFLLHGDALGDTARFEKSHELVVRAREKDAGKDEERQGEKDADDVERVERTASADVNGQGTESGGGKVAKRDVRILRRVDPFLRQRAGVVLLTTLWASVQIRQRAEIVPAVAAVNRRADAAVLVNVVGVALKLLFRKRHGSEFDVILRTWPR